MGLPIASFLKLRVIPSTAAEYTGEEFIDDPTFFVVSERGEWIQEFISQLWVSVSRFVEELVGVIFEFVKVSGI